MRHKPFPDRTDDEKAKSPLELIHSDLIGPIKPRSKGGKNYCLKFTDDFTHYVAAYFLVHKSEMLDKFKLYKNEVENQLGAKIEMLRSDGGGEYRNKFDEFCAEHGIKRQFTIPRTPQQNGVSERMGQTLLDMARCYLIESGLPKYFWADAIYTACHVRNKCPSEAIGNEIPEELWTKNKVNIDYLRVFGCRVWCILDEA